MSQIYVATGVGKLHMVETAVAVANSDRAVSLLTGWAPSAWQKPFVEMLGRVLGQRNLYDRLSVRRRAAETAGCRVIQCPISEVLMTVMARTWLAENSMLNSAIWALCGREIASRLKEGRVFHVRSGAGGSGAIRKARELGMRIVVDHSIAHPATIWNNLSRFGASKIDARRFHPDSRFWRRVMNDCARADVIVVNSDFVKDTLVEHGFSSERIRVVYLGIDNVFSGAKTEHRKIEGTPLRALFVGHFIPRKGAHVLLAAAQILKQRGIECRFEVAGMPHNGPDEVEQLGLSELFKFHGLLGRQESREVMSRADLFVFPTLAEGCAKAAMEALGAGLPVLTTRECGLPRAAEGFVRLLKLGDAEDTATAILEVGADTAMRAKWGRMGGAFVTREHSPLCFRKAIGSLYDELLEGRTQITDIHAV